MIFVKVNLDYNYLVVAFDFLINKLNSDRLFNWTFLIINKASLNLINIQSF